MTSRGPVRKFRVDFFAEVKHTIVLFRSSLFNSNCQFAVSTLIYRDGQLMFAIPSKATYSKNFFCLKCLRTFIFI